MPSVTIDSCVLAVPSSDTSREEIIAYVQTLSDWKRLLKDSWLDIYMSEKASEKMQENEVYPIRSSLATLFKQKGLQTIYSANDIARFVDTVLRGTPYLEDYLQVQNVLADEVSTIPDLSSVHTSKDLFDDLTRCVVIISILRSCCRFPVLDHNLIVKPWHGSMVVHVKAQVYEIKTTRNDLLALPVPPEFFEGDILTCQNFRELVLNLDEAAIWKAAVDEVGLELAVKIAVYKSRLERNIEPDWDTIQGFRFGCEFFHRMRTCEQGGNPGLAERTLRALAETIDGLKMTDVHAKRTGKGGGDPQETRGQDKAWRRDIDYQYHLHYWESIDGTIEFASVGPHNMFDIPRGG